MKRALAFALTAIISAALGATALWWFGLKPAHVGWLADRVRADRESARAAAIDKELAESRIALDATRASLDGARSTIGRLANQLEGSRKSLVAVEARLREIESSLGSLGGAIVDLGGAIGGDAELARRATAEVRRALAIAIRLSARDATSGL